MALNQKCNCCNTEYNHFDVTKIEKNWYCKACTDAVTDWTGFFPQTEEDMTETRNQIKRYYNLVTNYLTEVRKYSVFLKVSVWELIRDVREQENYLAIKLFGKTRNCLRWNEHFLLISENMKTFNTPAGISGTGSNGTETPEMKLAYLKDLSIAQTMLTAVSSFRILDNN